MSKICVKYILADLEPNFRRYFLKLLDDDDDLIIEINRIKTEFAKTLKSLQFPKLDMFTENLVLDDYRNLSAKIKANDDNTHDISSNFSN